MDEQKEIKNEQKKEMNPKLIIQVLAVVAGALLILLICDSAFGNGAFSWLNKSKSQEIIPTGYNGLLVGSLTGSAENLENYEVMYNSEGKLVYELINNGKNINVGEGYKILKSGTDVRTVIIAVSSTNLQQKYLTCGCVGPKCLSSAKDPCTLAGDETFSCGGTYTLGEEEGACRFVPKGWI